jgi:hypothetical protein
LENPANRAVPSRVPRLDLETPVVWAMGDEAGRLNWEHWDVKFAMSGGKPVTYLVKFWMTYCE